MGILGVGRLDAHIECPAIQGVSAGVGTGGVCDGCVVRSRERRRKVWCGCEGRFLKSPIPRLVRPAQSANPNLLGWTGGFESVGGFRWATREEVLSKSFCQVDGDEIVTVSNSQLSCMQPSICAILRSP